MSYTTFNVTATPNDQAAIGADDATTRHAAELQPGVRVEVRRKFDHAWAQGFVINGQFADGYELLRCSDGAILPVRFPAEDLRPAVTR